MQKTIDNQAKELETLKIKLLEAQKKLKKDSAQKSQPAELDQDGKNDLLKDLKEKQRKNESKMAQNQHKIQ